MNTTDTDWVIESYSRVGWATSRLNRNAFTHSLEWCIEEWKRFKAGIAGDKLATEKHLYRLRNVKTEDILMCAIL